VITHSGLAALLARWLPTRRWFGGGGQRIERVDLVRVVEIGNPVSDPAGLLVIAAVQLVNGVGSEVRHYQIPLGVRTGDPPWVLADDSELMALLLRMIAEGRLVDHLRFTAESPGALAFARRAGLRVRRTGGEQSNTSVVFGDRFILKLFRRLATGLNPDLDVHRRLRGPHLATLVGAIESRLDTGPATLGIAQEFVPDATDGWSLVTGALTSAMPAGNSGSQLLSALAELGGAVAAVHRQLAEAFGTATLTTARAQAVRARLRDRLEVAAQEVAMLRQHLPRLRAVIDEAGWPEVGGRVQRIHGDLHLGQVLHSGAGWLVIDFEGEPAASIEDRVAWRSPLQDIAGMMRSLDYAVGHLVLEQPHLATRAERWGAAARDAFCRGYAASAGGPLPGASTLLRAYELDKAVYEVVYETRNRPEWLRIPLGAIERFCAGAHHSSPRRPNQPYSVKWPSDLQK
jgi:maltokinase